MISETWVAFHTAMEFIKTDLLLILTRQADKYIKITKGGNENEEESFKPNNQ